jgi:acyl-CoA synthetase (AMP-forming)/AMP-acid ligase II
MYEDLEPGRGYLAGPSLAARLQISLGEGLPISASRHPDKTCFLFADGTGLSFAQVNSRVNRLVTALRARGVRKGDRIALFALDSSGYVEVVLAALKLGAVYVPLNYRLSRREVETLLARSEPVALFYDERYAAMLDGIAGSCPSLRSTIQFGAKTGPGPYELLLAEGDDIEPPVVTSDADTIGLAFTSGTTGLPKGVVQSHRMMKAVVRDHPAIFDVRPGDLRYMAAPAFHSSGTCSLIAGVWYGYTSLILPQFDPGALLRILARDDVTGMFLVPTMIATMLQQPGVAELPHGRLRSIHYGAAPMSPALLRRAMEVFHCDFVNLFGAGTEAGLQTILGPEDHRRALNGEPELLGSIGKPSYGVALRLVDDDMKDVPAGEVGEIATRSDMVMDGYLGMPEETARSFRDGWFRAGDMAYVGKNGYLYLHGRKRDMIIRGGENIYPIEIETVIAEHPDVVQCAVVGVPDDYWGEIVRAFVVVRAGAQISGDDLRGLCASQLAKFKVPAEFRFEESLPTNASGKILKRELRLYS